MTECRLKIDAEEWKNHIVGSSTAAALLGKICEKNRSAHILAPACGKRDAKFENARMGDERLVISCLLVLDLGYVVCRPHGQPMLGKRPDVGDLGVTVIALNNEFGQIER